MVEYMLRNNKRMDSGLGYPSAINKCNMLRFENDANLLIGGNIIVSIESVLVGHGRCDDAKHIGERLDLSHSHFDYLVRRRNRLALVHNVLRRSEPLLFPHLII